MQLNIVYSIGKTASTSLFTSWGSNAACLPVVHTHDMRHFTAVDRVGTPFVRHVAANKNLSVFGEDCPNYIQGESYTEFRFILAEGCPLSDAFPDNIFSRTKIVGVIRNPVHRRVSQFCNATTLQSVNSYMDSNMIDEEHLTSDTTAGDLLRIAPFVTNNRLLTELIDIVSTTGKLPGKEDLRRLFRKFFCGCDLPEYQRYLSGLQGMFPTLLDLGSFAKDGYLHVRSNNTELLLFSMERLCQLQPVVRKYTGIDTPMRHDGQIEKQKTMIDVPAAELKKYLLAHTTLGDLGLGPVELKIVRALGYT